MDKCTVTEIGIVGRIIHDWKFGRHARRQSLGWKWQHLQ